MTTSVPSVEQRPCPECNPDGTLTKVPLVDHPLTFGWVFHYDNDYLCETCRASLCGCKAVKTFGLARVEDGRCFGGLVDREGYRHDPVRHADDCPLMST